MSENLASALSKAQSVMAGAKKDKKNPFYKSSYADLASVFDAIREPFAANGLAVSQTMDVREDGRTVLRTRLMHASGEYLEGAMMLPDDPNPQKMGSAITYYRRYSLMAIAGIPAEDDDGNAASTPSPKRISADQVAAMEELINGNDGVREQVMKHCHGDMSTITVDRYPGAMRWIKRLIDEGAGND